MKKDYSQEEEIELVDIPLNGESTFTATEEQPPTEIIEEEEEKIEVSEGEKKRQDVVVTRIKNELKVISGAFDHSFIEVTKTIHIYLKNPFYNLTLELGPHTFFPFMPPLFKFTAKSEESAIISLFDLKRATFEDLMLEHWHPSIKIVDIAERAEVFIRKNVTRVTDVPGKLIKIVNAKKVSDIVKKIIGFKMVIGFIMILINKD
jgi:hypothetical protein